MRDRTTTVIVCAVAASYVVLYFALARPLLAIARQMEAFVKQMQEQSSRPPSSPA